MSMDPSQEIWRIESAGHVIETNFEEITALIDRGELLRMDRVRKGDLRWIEAGKVPSLLAVFNAKEGSQPSKPVITLTKLGPPTMPGRATHLPASADSGNAGHSAPSAGHSDTNVEPFCAMHDGVPAAFVCSTCFSNFCKACPKSYGGTVKICPYCGAMCDSLAQVEGGRVQAVDHATAIGGGFGFSDFIDALSYPFRFKASLIMGAVMYMFCSLGQGAMGFGGIVMMGAALGSYMLANTLVFGVLSNTVENFAQGKIGENFMPSFDEFSLWDDVVHPFFLSIGVYISSFGPLILLVVVAFFFVSSSVTKEMNGLQSDAARIINPELPYAAKATEQSQAVRELIARTNEKQKRRLQEMESGELQNVHDPEFQSGPRPIAPEAEKFNRQQQQAAETQKDAGLTASANTSNPVTDDTEEAVMRANESIQKMRQAQAEAIVGKSPDTKAKESSDLWATIIGYGLIFLLLGGICLLWGLFYFPAACAVAGYTQSFAATVNPAVGIDTIKRLGLDYVKILLMGFGIVVMTGIIGAVFSFALVAFDLPGVGNLPARAIGSLFGFYFSIVFSCILGFALYKAGDRLRLPS